MLLGQDLELFLAQLVLRGLALGVLCLDDLAAADGPQLHAVLADGRGQQLVIVRGEQQAARRLGQAARAPVAEVVEAGARDAACQILHRLAAGELAA